MILRNSILLLVVTTLLNACFDSTQRKSYSITTYFTSLDSSSKSMGKEGQKFKSSYEEYNSDSNLIYQELYATTDHMSDMWGKLFEKTKFTYKGKEKMRAEREFGLAYPLNEQGKVSYIYEYTNGQLSKWLSDGKPIEEYKYNEEKDQIERRIINELNIPEYYRFFYHNGVKTKTQYFVADTIVRVDTFIYDQNKQLVEKYSYDSKGQKAGHTLTIRNNKGQPIEDKWREPFQGWRMRNDGQIIDDEFYQSNKYYYDIYGRPLKTEFYDIGRLMTIYQFVYD